MIVRLLLMEFGAGVRSAGEKIADQFCPYVQNHERA